jgi:hypothetical protein
MLRHSKIETTMNLYTQDENDNKVEAQGKYLEALGFQTEVRAVMCGLSCG